VPLSLSFSRHRAATVVVLVVALWIVSLAVWPAARAAVGLSAFTATADPATGTIQVTWATETEVDVAAFRVLRNTTPETAGAQQVDQQPARGTPVTGADYSFADTTATPGATYYYWLYELTVDGQLNLLRTSLMAEDYVSAALPGATPTATPTATPLATNTPTATRPATSTPITATPLRTSTPTSTFPATSSTTATPVVRSGITPTVPQPGSTPIPQPSPIAATPATASLATAPVSPPAQQPSAPAIIPAAPVPPGDQPLSTAGAAGSPAGAASGEASGQASVAPGATPMVALATAQVLATRPTVGVDQPSALLQARPTATPQPRPRTADRSNTTSLVAIVGGGTLCGASLLILAAIVVWRRT
jgi:hypothetical protein